MSDFRASALQYAQDHRDRFLAEFKDFVSIASVSTDPQSKPEIEKTAEWVAGQASVAWNGDFIECGERLTGAIGSEPGVFNLVTY